MEDTIINLVGYSAAFFGTTLMLPQVVKTWRLKRTEDMSLLMAIFYFMNCLLWLIYAYLISATPLLITNAIALVIGSFLLYFKVKY